MKIMVRSQYNHKLLNIFMYTILVEPDVEVWDKDEEDIIADLSEDELLNLAENAQVDVVPRRSRILTVRLLRFLMILCWDTLKCLELGGVG